MEPCQKVKNEVKNLTLKEKTSIFLKKKNLAARGLMPPDPL